MVSCSTLAALSSRLIAFWRSDAAQHGAPKFSIAIKIVSLFIARPLFPASAPHLSAHSASAPRAQEHWIPDWGPGKSPLRKFERALAAPFEAVLLRIWRAVKNESVAR